MKPELAPNLFLSTTVPVVQENTIIVAATHPNLRAGDPTEDGWFLSDFYAFNYLFKGLGRKQVWLTAADPNKLVEKYGTYLHGYPYSERKECLSQNLLRDGKFTPVTIVPTARMIDRFLEEAKIGSELAKKTDGHLLLLVFCHGLPNFDLLLDNGNTKKGLSMTRLKGVLDFGANVSLVTTACYSGGWAVSPQFNHTVLAAASDSGDEEGASNAWSASQSIGRTCGSVFASTLMESLSSAASPILEHQERLALAGIMEPEESLQPEDPTNLQTLTYNEFCHSIWGVCEHRITRLWEFQHFTFSAQDDSWEYSWCGRTGIPLKHFEDRWNQLPSYPYQGPTDVQASRNVNPSNPAFTGEDSAKTGGVQDLVHEMTSSIAHGRIRAMVECFRQTCPGDWESGWQPSLAGRMRSYCEHLGHEDDALEFASTIRFRWEMGLLTDFLVQRFSLPIPDNQMCIMWHRNGWKARMGIGSSYSDCTKQKRYKKVYKALGDCLEPSRHENQGHEFYRPHEYFAAALYEANKSWEETLAIIEEVRNFLKEVVKFHHQNAMQDSRTRGRGRNWLKSLGKKALRSISPRKSGG
ncbi:hypothetical protein N7488_004793 [Penicillium malachiteum]|nr:hypothetical protein N7488_004793 [Penicillium malachiteum]